MFRAVQIVFLAHFAIRSVKSLRNYADEEKRVEKIISGIEVVGNTAIWMSQFNLLIHSIGHRYVCAQELSLIHSTYRDIGIILISLPLLKFSYKCYNYLNTAWENGLEVTPLTKRSISVMLYTTALITSALVVRVSVNAISRDMY